jgi:hypothetical protein
MSSCGICPLHKPQQIHHFLAALKIAFWQREFAGDSNVLMRNVTLNGKSLPIIGVTPRSFLASNPDSATMLSCRSARTTCS